MAMSRKKMHDCILGQEDVVCAVCGGKHPTTVDHFVPLAVIKWCNECQSKGTLIQSVHNLVPSCEKCNLLKSSRVPSLGSVKPLHVTDEKKGELRHIIRLNAGLLTQYRALVQKVLKRQHYQCKRCGRKITMTTTTIRRADDSKPRTLDNAIALCTWCNLKRK